MRKAVNRSARPVCNTMPITIPALAQAIATGTVCTAPSRRPSRQARQRSPVEGRIHEMATSAAVAMIAP